MMTLFYSPGACSLASRIALEEADCIYQDHLVDIRNGDNLRPDYLALNPRGRVPALLTDKGLIAENCAILAFVAQSFPQAGLGPLDDPFAFARMQSINATISTTLHPLFRNFGRPHLFVDGEAACSALRRNVRALLHDQFRLLDQLFDDGRDWLLGADYCVADGYLAVFCGYFDNAFSALGQFQGLSAHRNRVWSRPAVMRAIERDGS